MAEYDRLLGICAGLQVAIEELGKMLPDQNRIELSTVLREMTGNKEAKRVSDYGDGLEQVCRDLAKNIWDPLVG